MVLENVELMHEYFPKHLYMGTVRLKKDKETEEEGKQKRVKSERSTASKKISTVTIAGAYHPFRGCYSSKQWLNYLTNLIL